jgi:uncharacterized membrane protein
MSEPTPNSTPTSTISSDEENTLRTLGIVSYVLHAIVAIGAIIPGLQASLVLLFVALVIDLVKQNDAQNTWMATHYRWRIRSVIWAGLLYLITAPLWILLVVPGMIAWFVVSLWFGYRILRGFLAHNDRKPIAG